MRSEQVGDRDVEPSHETSSAELLGENRAKPQMVIPLRWLVVGLVAVVVTGLAGWLGYRALEHYQQNVATEQALEAAVQYTEELANVDYNTIDRNFDDLQTRTTDQLNAKHVKDGERIRKIVVDKKVSAHSDIVEATIVSAAKNRVTVVLVVDQTIADMDNPGPDVERNRIAITMDKIDGRWLASNVEL